MTRSPNHPRLGASQLEFVACLTLVAALSGWWMLQFEQAQADIRLLRVRDTAQTLRSLGVLLHLQGKLQAQREGTARPHGTPADLPVPTEQGLIATSHGYPRATADGIGRLLAAHASARDLRCEAIALPHPVNLQQRLEVYECAPAELPAAARAGCAARYFAPLAPGLEPGVTFVLHGQAGARADEMPCAMP